MEYIVDKKIEDLKLEIEQIKTMLKELKQPTNLRLQSLQLTRL